METETANSYAEYLLSLTKSGEWNEYMQEWERRQELALETATNFYKDEIELLDKEFGSKLTDMLNNMTSEAGKIGQEIAAALAAGILSGQTAVDQAVQSLMPGATFTGGAAAGGTAASQSATINLTVELDGRQVAKGTYPYILEEGKIQGESQIGG
jgi:hypothetical protein